MNSFDEQYILLIKKVLSEGDERITRSGAGTTSIFGQMIKHDMSNGFPLTTLRNIPFRLVASELKWTLDGKTDKKSLNEYDNHIWDKFCNPKFVKDFKPNQETYDLMKNQNDLGPIYGFQWRHFGAEYIGSDSDYSGQGFDQIKDLVEKLSKRVDSKRFVVTNWNPKDVPEMAVPSCPCMFQIIRHGEKLNLSFFQRSTDCMVGFPFDFAFHALLLHLFCLQTGLKEGSVVGFFNNIEIFSQHIEGAKELVKRESKKLGELKTENFKDIFDWKFTDTQLVGYEPNDRMKFEVNISS